MIEKENYVSRAPWSVQPNLKEMTEDVGINFDLFIDSLKNNKNDMEIANEFNVSEKAINSLRLHFEKYGLQSIIGQD
jgi:hypothetical protein